MDGLIQRFHLNGRLDRDFAPVRIEMTDESSWVNNVKTRILVTPENKIIITGHFNKANGVETAGIIQVHGGFERKGPLFLEGYPTESGKTWYVRGQPAERLIVETSHDLKNWTETVPAVSFLKGEAEITVALTESVYFLRAHLP